MCSLVFVLGCKSNEKDKEPAPPPASPAHKDPVPPPVGSGAGSGGFQLGTGETYFGGKVSATNFVDWKLEDGSIVQLGIVTTRLENGTEESGLRVYSTTTPSYQVGWSFTLDATKDHWAELKPVQNKRMLFRFGADGESRSARNAMLLRWDAPSKRVVIAKQWSGAFKDAEPTWLATGTYTVTSEPATEGNCLKVIAKMVACEKDPKFREAMFARAKEPERPAMQAHFDTHIASWRTGPEAKKQCARWATDDYTHTHFADPGRLVNLAEDTKMKCDEFAREVVDDGGLPVAVTDAG